MVKNSLSKGIRGNSRYNFWEFPHKTQIREKAGDDAVERPKKAVIPCAECPRLKYNLSIISPRSCPECGKKKP